MRLICRVWQRFAPHTEAPVGSKPNSPAEHLHAQHLERCAACRQDIADRNALAARLAASAALRPDPAFAQDLWQRIDLAQSRQQPTRIPPRRSLSTSALSGAAALCGLLLARKFMFAPHALYVQTPPAQIAATARQPASIIAAATRHPLYSASATASATGSAHLHVGKAATNAYAAARLPRTGYGKARHVKGGTRNFNAPALARQERGGSGQSARPAADKQARQIAMGTQGEDAWTRAASCEQSGDYAGASQAYRQAYALAQEPSAAYAAGRTAEISGKTPDALEDYARVLSADAAARSAVPTTQQTRVD